MTNHRCLDAIAEYAEAARVAQPNYGLLVDWGLAYECADQPGAAVAKLREAAVIPVSTPLVRLSRIGEIAP